MPTMPGLIVIWLCLIKKKSFAVHWKGRWSGVAAGKVRSGKYIWCVPFIIFWLYEFISVMSSYGHKQFRTCDIPWGGNIANKNVNDFRFIPVNLIRKNTKIESKPVCAKEGTIRILFVGRLSVSKGVKTIIRSMSYIDRYVITKIIGSGPLNKEVCKSDVPSNCGEVHIIGSVEWGSSLWKYYKWANVFVLPSYYEGFPKALLEAMYFGVPCIATDVGEISNRLNAGRDVMIVRPGRPNEISKCINRLCWDKKLRRKLSKNGREYSRKNTRAVTAKRFQKILEI